MQTASCVPLEGQFGCAFIHDSNSMPPARLEKAGARCRLGCCSTGHRAPSLLRLRSSVRDEGAALARRRVLPYPPMDLEPLRDALEAQPAVRLAVVFGSAARSRSTPEATWIWRCASSPQTAATRREALVAAGRAARREIHLVELDAAPPLLGFQIARDGVLLVEREPWAWARFKAHAMVEWWEWAPSARKIEAA